MPVDCCIKVLNLSNVILSLCAFVCFFSMEDFYPSKNHGPDSGIGSDNGDKRLSTTEVNAHIRTLVIHAQTCCLLLDTMF